jgi:hypothetical protein
MKHTNHSDSSTYISSISYKENQAGGILMKKIVKIPTVLHITKKSKGANETSHIFECQAY